MGTEKASPEGLITTQWQKNNQSQPQIKSKNESSNSAKGLNSSAMNAMIYCIYNSRKEPQFPAILISRKSGKGAQVDRSSHTSDLAFVKLFACRNR